CPEPPATLENAQNHEGYIVMLRGFTRERVDSLCNGDKKIAGRSTLGCFCRLHQAFNTPLLAHGVRSFNKTVCVRDDHVERVKRNGTNVVTATREQANRRTAAVKPLNRWAIPSH